jgi:hypothetical protein
MDDESIQNKGLHLNTKGFIPEDILKLKKTLENMIIVLNAQFINI